MSNASQASAPPSVSEIRSAARRIEPYAHRTPVMTCAGLDELAGASLFFKCENLQKAGAFKFRGACNAVFSLTQAELERGVATHSSGNHGAALALAARLRATSAVVVMPKNSAAVKKAAVRYYGAEIIECEPNEASRHRVLEDVVRSRGCAFLHPFDDLRIIAGQGTAALELLEQIPDLDVVLTPVGGGGLLSGTAIVASETSSRIQVIGAEPEMADDALRSFEAGRIIAVEEPDTIADGLRTSLGELTFPVIRERVASIVTVSERAIASAMRLAWERMKLVIEPSAAVPLAAVLERRVAVAGRRVAIILSGGNVDLEGLPWSPSQPR